LTIRHGPDRVQPRSSGKQPLESIKRGADPRIILALMPLPTRDAELVQIVDATLADAARRAGELLACRIGCTQCCHGAFAINALDAARLRAGMTALHATDTALAMAIELRARAWLDKHGQDFPGDPETGILGTSKGDQARFEDFANEAACPALDLATGRCDVYQWRPMTCRIFGPPVRAVGESGAEGLGHCELCFIGATPDQVAACEMPVPHELEGELLEEMGSRDETVVAFALLR
jgi:Fe-S-cluster containining protein